MSLKPKPWWLDLVTPASAWVTIQPNIYVPNGFDAASYPALIAHESVHLRQQEMVGRWVWLWRYIWKPEWMLSQESQAVATEMLASPKIERVAIRERYVIAFTAGAYKTILSQPCACSTFEARQSIMDEYCKITTEAL